MQRRFRILERKIEHGEKSNMEYYQYHFGPMNIRHEVMVSNYSNITFLNSKSRFFMRKAILGQK